MTNNVTGQDEFDDGTSLNTTMTALGVSARNAFQEVSNITTDSKNIALLEAAKAIRESAKTLEGANAKDIFLAKKNNTPESILDRLFLDDTRIEAMAAGLETIATLDDPIGTVMAEWVQPNGL